MKVAIFAVVCLIISCCGAFKKEPAEADPISRETELRVFYTVNLAKIKKLIDPETTWPTSDCDGMIWAARAAAAGVTEVDIGRAEYPGEPGKFGRRPPIAGKWCYQDGTDFGSKTSWSGDMGKAGLIPWAMQTGRLETLRDHFAYGKAHGWRMGDPAGDDRVYYKPNLRGWLARAIKYLGGKHDDDAYIPDVYAAGLVDYQAHLQMIGIWQYGMTDGAILPVMAERIAEHAERSPETLFYRFMEAKWLTGDYDVVVDILLTDGESAGEYVRCGGEPGCQLAEKLWIAKMIFEEITND